MLWQMAMPNICNGMALFQTIRYKTVRLTSVANNKHAFFMQVWDIVMEQQQEDMFLMPMLILDMILHSKKKSRHLQT